MNKRDALQAYDFSDKVVLITGASSGIGRVSALKFAELGASVILVGRRLELLEAVAKEVHKLGAKATVMTTDLSSAASAQKLFQECKKTFGRLDAAFNNAGIEGHFAPIVDQTVEQFDEVIHTNLRGTWLCCKYEMDLMTSGGSIVNNASWLGVGAFAGSSIYSASKAGLDGMIRALAQEGAEHQIRFNNIQPGIIDTPMFRRFADDAAAVPFIQHTPMRRLGEPKDIADVVVFLCSDASKFITGQSILVDGGYTIAGHRAWLSEEITSEWTNEK